MSILLQALNEAAERPMKKSSLAAKHLMDGLKRVCPSNKPVYKWIEDELPKSKPNDYLDVTDDEYKNSLTT